VVSQSRSGGWPKSTYVNLQPNGAKSLFRINKEALQDFLKTQDEQKEVTEEAKVEEETTPCSTGQCPV
jgi:hypothetical protein